VKFVVVLVALGGCSIATTRAPEGSPPECTESRAAPVVDLLVAVASPFVAYAVLDHHDHPTGEVSAAGDKLGDGMHAVGVTFPVWAVFGASSIYGFINTGRCSRAKSNYHPVMTVPPGPGMYAPPPIAPSGAPPPVVPPPPTPVP
jgi:hypothetical protein